MPQLGLPKQQGTNNIQKAHRLGISSNKLNYKDSFTSIDSKKVKLLINHLNDSGYFKLNKFNSELYVDQNAFKNAQSKKIIEASSIKKDNIIIPQDRIPLKTKKSKEELEKEIKEWNYYLLSKSLSLNTTISFIDNNSSSNGYYVHIDYKNKIISYGYSIYYNVPDGVIQIINKEIITEKQNIAITLKTAGVGTLLFFLEEVYGKEAANVIRSEIYEKYKVELERASNVETLAFLYDNLPNYIKLGYDDKEDIESKPYKLPDELLWKHLDIFIDYDKGSKDASYYVLYVISLISPKFLMQKFLKNQSLVISIYNGLDDEGFFDFFLDNYSQTFNNGSNTYKPSNKDYFVTLLNSYIQLYENDKEVAVFETSGAHFHQGTKKGGKYDVEVKFTLDSNIVSSDEYKNKVKIHNKWESKQYLGQAWDSQGKIHDKYEYGRGYNESGYYNPLDVVKFTQYNDKGEALTINAPAIFVKYASDIKEWEKVNEGIRFGANVVMIIAGVATIATGTGSLLLYAAIADIGLASSDIIIQSKKDEAYFKSKEGKEFLESWEKIYTIGGVVTFSPVAVKAVVTYGPKIVSSGADLLQVTGKTITNPEVYKKVKDLTTKAIHSLEIPNFNKTGLEILKKGFTGYAELKNAKKLQNLGVIFVKGGENTMAIIYKGVSIIAGKVDEISEKLQTALKKLSGKKLENYLDELLEVALDNIQGKGLYGGKILSKADLDVWAKTLLKKYGTKLEKVDSFENSNILAQFDSNTNTILYKDDVTEYIMLHESFHAEEMSKIGFAKYNKGAALKGVDKADYTKENWLNLYRKEKYVYDKLVENAKKYNLNPQELSTPPYGHAFRYFDLEVVMQLELRNIPIPKK
ncbi:MAG: hypothetical protein MUF43_03710 [Flavobacterium sp.]|nr:hypothetical protein [Flavobacterium sp.]